MVKQLDIAELQTCIADAIRQVQQGETIEIVSEGHVVAVLVRPTISIDAIKDAPVPDIEERRAALARLDALAEEIGKHVTWPTNAAELISEMRR